MKRTSIKLSVFFLLVSLTVSTVSMIPTVQGNDYQDDNVKEPETFVNSFNDEQKDEVEIDSTMEEDSENYINSEFLDKYRLDGKESDIDFSLGLTEKIASTPKSLWSSTDVRLVISFDERDSLLDDELSKYQPEILDILPMAIIDTNLAELRTIYSLKGVKGIYMNERFQIDDGWEATEVGDDVELHMYPSESRIGARDLLDLGIDGTGVKIAILDTGIDKYHPDLDDMDNDPYTDDPKVILEKSFIDYDGDGIADTGTLDGYGHGTHCAGIAAGNGVLKGVAPNAWLINARIGDDYGQLEVTWLLKAIDWAVVSGADIISMSLGWGTYNVMPLLNEAANYAWERGVILTVSAGNSGPDLRTTASPGMASRCITVGATNIDDEVTEWSSRGPSINGLIDPDVVAPGEDILSTLPGNTFGVSSGTSMSAPAVAGVAALLLSAYPAEDISIIRSAIVSTATDLGEHIYTQGTGMVNAKAAYDYLLDPSPFVFPGFTENSTLVLSPGEKMEFQCDLYLDEDYSSISIEPATELLPYLTVEIIDPIARGWVRTKISLTMPAVSLNSSIDFKNGSTILYSVPLCLSADVEQNDAYSSTDAGDMLAGALPVVLNASISGQVFDGGCDFYSIPVIKGQYYGVDLIDHIGAILIILHDENGTLLDYSVFWSTPSGNAFIFEALNTGDYFISIQCTFDEMSDYSLIAYETDIQETSEKVYIIGNYDDYGLDDNSDGLYEALVITFEVYANVSGTYDFGCTIHQKRTDYNFPKYYVGVYFFSQFLDEGINVVTLHLSGDIISPTNYNGKYILGQLLIGDPSTFTIIVSENDLYTTSIYRSNWFEKPDNRIVYLYVEDINLDGHGNPEYMQITAMINFASTGEFEFVLEIIDESQYYIIEGLYAEVVVTEIGNEEVTFDLYPQSFDPNRNIVLARISNYDLGMANFIYTLVPASKLQEYDPLITYSISDVAKDTDGSGNFDTIEFTYVINSKISALVYAYLDSPISLVNETFVPSSSTDTHYELVDEGITSFTIEWEATKLRQLQLNAPLLFAKTIFHVYLGNTYLRIQGYHVTNSYDYMDFDYPDVRISDYFGTEKFFANETAGYRMTFEVTATKEVDIEFEVSIDNTETSGAFYEYTETIVHVYEGKTNITLEFDYAVLFEFKFVGDLLIETATVRRFGLYDELDSMEDIDIIEDVDYMDFVNYFDAYTLDFQTEFVDNNTDGLYEGVYLYFDVNVSKTGIYHYTFRTYDFLDVMVYESNDRDFNHSGIYNFTFFISAETIVRSLQYSPVVGYLTLYHETTNYTWYDRYEFEFELDASEFYYDLPIEFLGIVEDEAIDTSGDGLYDLLVFVIQVNCSVPRYPNLDMFLDFKSLGNILIDYWRIDTFGRYCVEGINNITLSFQAYELRDLDSRMLAYGMEPIVNISISGVTAQDGIGRFYATRDIFYFSNTYDLRQFDTRDPAEILDVLVEIEEPIDGDFAHIVLVTAIYRVNKQIDIVLDLRVYLNEEGSSYTPDIYESRAIYDPEEGTFNYTFILDISSYYYNVMPEELGIRVGSLYLRDFNQGIIDRYERGDYEYYNMFFGTHPTPTDTSYPLVTTLGLIALVSVLLLKKKRKER